MWPYILEIGTGIFFLTFFAPTSWSFDRVMWAIQLIAGILFILQGTKYMWEELAEKTKEEIK